MTTDPDTFGRRNGLVPGGGESESRHLSAEYGGRILIGFDERRRCQCRGEELKARMTRGADYANLGESTRRMVFDRIEQCHQMMTAEDLRCDACRQWCSFAEPRKPATVVYAKDGDEGWKLIGWLNEPIQWQGGPPR